MGKNKGKRHSHKDSKTKRAHSSPDGKRARETPSFFGHVTSSGWVQNCAVACLGFLVLLGVAMWTRTQVKSAAIAFGLMATALVWIVVSIVITYQPDQGVAFALLFKTFDGSHDSHCGAFWCRYSSSFGDTLSPAPVALYLTMKNMGSTPLYVERLEVSVQKRGQWGWVMLRHIPSDGCRMYWIYGDATKAKLLDMDGLDRRWRSSIPSGETVLGWLFFATIEPCPVKKGDEIKWRLRVKDSSGRESQCTSPFEAINNRPVTDPAARQSVPIKVTGIQEDLSKLYFRIFEPFPYK